MARTPLDVTGLSQPETILVLVPRAETTARSGVKTVNFVTDFEPFTTALFDRRVYGARRIEASSETRHERHREAT